MHLMRWSAAIENWHRIHYDLTFAVEHDRLPGLLINGSWKQHILVQMLKAWIGPRGWVGSLEFQYRSADICGDTITAFGEVTGRGTPEFVDETYCSIGLKNQRGEVSTIGSATVHLPGPRGVSAKERSVARLPRMTIAQAPRASAHLSEQVLARIGIPGTRVFAPEPVDLSSVRRLAQAIMDDDPIYFDEGAAKEAGFESVVAPPLFPLHMHRRHPGSPDPFDEAVAAPENDGAGDVIAKHGLPPLDIALPRLLNGGNQIWIRDLARIGDTLSSVSTITDLREKSGRSGPLVFVKIDTEYRAVNRDALLLRGRQTYIYR
ncbi:MAG: MaoC family dehydratase N-terminal domain-containing protein [Pseudomonadota bacterium]|nr:MaoC family dehydratase N-terminal domain-containing protein [Pseudomonadota bacterium]